MRKRFANISKNVIFDEVVGVLSESSCKSVERRITGGRYEKETITINHANAGMKSAQDRYCRILNTF